MSGQTRAELLKRIDVLTEERDHWRYYAPADKEAEAIARCVKALEPLADTRQSIGYSKPPAVSVRRAIHYLAQRHGFTVYDEPQQSVEWVECPSCHARADAERKADSARWPQ